MNPQFGFLVYVFTKIASFFKPIHAKSLKIALLSLRSQQAAENLSMPKQLEVTIGG
jgi:hypothetical protein